MNPENRETLDVIATFSTLEQREIIINDTRKVHKAQVINVIRQSPGYMKFINKFKKKMTGIVNSVERNSLTRYSQTIPQKQIKSAKLLLDKIDTFEFNIFEVDRLFGKLSLFHVLNEILNKYKFLKNYLVENKYVNFIKEISDGYNRDIPYHNDLHATDVLQTTHLIILKADIAKVNNIL